MSQSKDKRPLVERKGHSQVTQNKKVIPQAKPTDKAKVAKMKTPTKSKKS